MKKFKIAVAAILLAGSSMAFTSCIGSFALYNKVLDWNRGLGDKWVSELAFLCLWAVPVYEVAYMIDVVVLNSIEFWTGSNPGLAYEKTIKTENDTFRVICNEKGYEITSLTSGQKTMFRFNEATQSWSVGADEASQVEFMSFIDANHVRMTTPDGKSYTVEASQAGVMAFSQLVGAPMMAAR